MQRGTAYLVFVFAAIVAIGGVELWYRSYLNERLQRYRDERAAIDRVEQTYQRPVLDLPTEQDAAPFYARVLPQFTRMPVDALRPALEAGADRYDIASDALLAGVCAPALGTDVQAALRSATVDWRLGYGTASETRFEHPREALALSLCLTIAGHRSAHAGAAADAARHYFDGLAVGCDLGNGNETMLVVAIRAMRENLQALIRLAQSSGDLIVLRRIAADAAQFDGRLPDGRAVFKRTVIWAENEVALQELESAHLAGGFGFVGLKQMLAARALKKEQALFDEALQIPSARSREDAARLATALRSHIEDSTSEMLRLVNLPRSAGLMVSALEVVEPYRSVLAMVDVRERALQPR